MVSERLEPLVFTMDPADIFIGAVRRARHKARCVLREVTRIFAAIRPHHAYIESERREAPLESANGFTTGTILQI